MASDGWGRTSPNRGSGRCSRTGWRTTIRTTGSREVGVGAAEGRPTRRDRQLDPGAPRPSTLDSRSVTGGTFSSPVAEAGVDQEVSQACCRAWGTRSMPIVGMGLRRPRQRIRINGNGRGRGLPSSMTIALAVGGIIGRMIGTTIGKTIAAEEVEVMAGAAAGGKDRILAEIVEEVGEVVVGHDIEARTIDSPCDDSCSISYVAYGGAIARPFHTVISAHRVERFRSRLVLGGSGECFSATMFSAGSSLANTLRNDH